MATNLQFVKEVNSTDVVSVTVTDLFNTNYDVYEVYLDMLYNASSYLDIQLLDSSGNVLTGSHYDTATLDLKVYATYGEFRLANSTIWRGLGGYMTNTVGGNIAKLTIYNPTATDKYTFASNQAGSFMSSGIFGVKGIANYKANDGVYGLKLFGSGGGSTTFDYLNVKCFGVK